MHWRVLTLWLKGFFIWTVGTFKDKFHVYTLKMYLWILFWFSLIMTIFSLNRQYTLVYVSSLDKFYLFGSGDEGQLEDERKPNQLIPLPINSPVNTGKSWQSNDHCRCIQSVSSMEMFAFLISCLHWKANIMSHACLAIPTNSTGSYSICCLIIMGSGLMESNFQQLTTIWRVFYCSTFVHSTLWRQWLSLQMFLWQSFCSFTEKGASKKGIKITAGVHQSFAHCKEENKVCTHLITASDFTTVHIIAGNI